MKQDRHGELIPTEFIRELWANTKDGKLSITYDSCTLEPPYSRNYSMDWNEEDAEKVVQLYETLEAQLKHLGTLHDELENPEKRKELLTEEERSVWETYICPYEPFEIDEDTMDQLYYRWEYDMDEEECELMERHYEWCKEQSLKRLPFERRAPLYVINRAQRYERLVCLNAPEVVLNTEGCFLAEEMVLYYCSLKEE